MGPWCSCGSSARPPSQSPGAHAFGDPKGGAGFGAQKLEKMREFRAPQACGNVPFSTVRHTEFCDVLWLGLLAHPQNMDDRVLRLARTARLLRPSRSRGYTGYRACVAKGFGFRV